jgi:hypothetical protein
MANSNVTISKTVIVTVNTIWMSSCVENGSKEDLIMAYVKV